MNRRVRSGVWGLASSLLLLTLPIARALNVHRRADAPSKNLALLLLFTALHWLIAGMSTEVTNLVFLASFVGLTLATWLGESFHQSEDNPPHGIARRHCGIRTGRIR